MSRLPVIVRPEAQEDLIAAASWYEEQRGGLGRQFLNRFSALIDRIAEMPEMYGVIAENVRAAGIRKFSYLAYYRVFPDRLEILAVLHASRGRGEVQSRISSSQ